jgi:hypothetical protein
VTPKSARGVEHYRKPSELKRKPTEQFTRAELEALRLYGSGRGAISNDRPYRNSHSFITVRPTDGRRLPTQSSWRGKSGLSGFQYRTVDLRSFPRFGHARQNSTDSSPITLRRL